MKTREKDIVFPAWLKVVLSIAALLLLFGGGWYYEGQQQQSKKEVENLISSIAKLKAKEIRDWRADRMANAEILMERKGLLRDVGVYLATGDEQASAEILKRLRSLRDHMGLADILLLDTEGHIRLSFGKEWKTPTIERTLLDRASEQHKPVWTSLHSDPDYPIIHISLVTPLFAAETDHAAEAFLVLINDAGQYLYPLIERWPVPSRTAETLLVRREGESVLFISELRHRKNTALKLSFPLSEGQMPAAMAVTGRKGVVDGKDYRGADVVASVRPIPDSKWYMVAKIDKEEAFGNERHQLLMIILLILGGLGLIGASAVVIHQRTLKANFRARYKAEVEFRKMVQRHSVTLRAIGDAVIATDAKGRVELMNPVAEALTGWKENEARGKTLAEVFHIISELTEKVAEDPVSRVLREGVVVGLANHTLLIARDGKRLPIADSGAPIRDEQGKINGVVLVFRDQTEARTARMLTEKRLELITYAVSHSLDEMLTHALDKIGLLVKSPIGFYHFVEPDQKTLSLQQWSTRTLAEFCKADGKDMHYDIDEAGVWVDCVNEKGPVVHNDYASLPHKKGLPDGHAEIIRELVVPVMREDKVVAILGVGNKATDYTERDVEMVSYFADVTWEIVNQKRGQQDQMVSEAKYQALFEGINDAVFVHPVKTEGFGKFIEVNDVACRRLRYSREELLNLSPKDISAPEDVDVRGSRDVRQQLLKDGWLIFEATHLTKEGKQIPVEISSRVFELNGVPVEMSLARDITDRKLTEEALLQSERDYRTMFENAHDAIIIFTPEAEIVLEANQRACEIYGFSRDEFIGMSLEKISVDVSRGKEYLRKVIKAGAFSRFETRQLRKDGTELFIEINASVVEYSGQRAILSINRDVTEQKRGEAERESLQAQLLQSQKIESVGRLAGGVAHDYNNMLGVILGRAEMLLAKMEPDDPNRGNIEAIMRAGQRSADLTRQLLAFARKQTIQPKVMNLNDEIEGMLKMLRRLIGENIDLDWKPAGGLWTVKMDPVQVDQILANLCVNARDAISDTGDVTIETENRVLDEAYCASHADCIPGAYVVLAVSDDGCGMDEATRTHIFEPFYTTKGVGQGTGLGLSTVYGIVRQNKGFINVYSEPGEGTTFRIYIPKHGAKMPAATETRVMETPHGKGQRVFLVEDEPVLLDMAKAMLEELGYHVETASLPLEALAFLKKNACEIDLLITDVVMPGMSGKGLAGEAKKLCKDLKVLFMSGYTANAIAHHGVLDKGVAFIQKPFSLSELAQKVKEVLDKP